MIYFDPEMMQRWYKHSEIETMPCQSFYATCAIKTSYNIHQTTKTHLHYVVYLTKYAYHN